MSRDTTILGAKQEIIPIPVLFKIVVNEQLPIPPQLEPFLPHIRSVNDNHMISQLSMIGKTEDSQIRVSVVFPAPVNGKNQLLLDPKIKHLISLKAADQLRSAIAKNPSLKSALIIIGPPDEIFEVDQSTAGSTATALAQQLPKTKAQSNTPTQIDSDDDSSTDTFISMDEEGLEYATESEDMASEVREKKSSLGQKPTAAAAYQQNGIIVSGEAANTKPVKRGRGRPRKNPTEQLKAGKKTELQDDPSYGYKSSTEPKSPKHCGRDYIRITSENYQSTILFYGKNPRDIKCKLKRRTLEPFNLKYGTNFTAEVIGNSQQGFYVMVFPEGKKRLLATPEGRETLRKLNNELFKFYNNHKKIVALSPKEEIDWALAIKSEFLGLNKKNV